MPERIVSNDEIKLFLGISGSSKDALVDALNDSMTEMLVDILGVADLGVHSVADERVEMVDAYKIHLEDFPVDIDETITVKNNLGDTQTGFTFSKDPKRIRTIRPYSSENSSLPYPLHFDEILISYTAGYILKDIIEVLSNTGLAEKTITVKALGVTTTYTFKATASEDTEIEVGGDTDATAQNIQEKITGSTVSGSVVTLPLGYEVSLGTATTSHFTITSNNIPKALKLAIGYMVAGGLSEQEKTPNLQSYTIGDKSVTFRNEGESNYFKSVLMKYGSPYLKVTIRSV